MNEENSQSEEKANERLEALYQRVAEEREEEQEEREEQLRLYAEYLDTLWQSRTASGGRINHIDQRGNSIAHYDGIVELRGSRRTFMAYWPLWYSVYEKALSTGWKAVCVRNGLDHSEASLARQYCSFEGEYLTAAGAEAMADALDEAFKSQKRTLKWEETYYPEEAPMLCFIHAAASFLREGSCFLVKHRLDPDASTYNREYIAELESHSIPEKFIV